MTASYKTKAFNTTNSVIAALRDWLLEQGVHDVCMESTGKYHAGIISHYYPEQYFYAEGMENIANARNACDIALSVL